jgi:hypothetical protein
MNILPITIPDSILGAVILSVIYFFFSILLIYCFNLVSSAFRFLKHARFHLRRKTQSKALIPPDQDLISPLR